MQRLNPGEFSQIYALQVIFATNPPQSQAALERQLETAVEKYMVDKQDYYLEIGEFNVRGKDPRSPMMQLEDAKRADEFAEKGTLKHYLLRKGFFPNNEADAEAILDRIIQEHGELQT
jgi:hypothetical protein